jgi:hypothetical protein
LEFSWWYDYERQKAFKKGSGSAKADMVKTTSLFRSFLQWVVGKNQENYGIFFQMKRKALAMPSFRKTTSFIFYYLDKIR